MKEYTWVCYVNHTVLVQNYVM